jgi:hypothetical protein
MYTSNECESRESTQEFGDYRKVFGTTVPESSHLQWLEEPRFVSEQVHKEND